MKRSNKICVLLGILFVICAAAFFVLRHEEKKELIKNSDEIILEIPEESVTALSWEYDSGSLGFHRDEKWLYDEDEAFPVDEEKIGELLGLFEEFGVSFVIEEVEDYSQYGLDDPVCTINLETEEETYEITLGGYSTMDSERYVSVGDGKVYLVKTDPMDYFEVGLEDMIDNDETPSLDTVTKLCFNGAVTSSILYEEDSTDTYCSDDVYFQQEDDKSLPLDTSRVKNYLRTISSLKLTDYVTYNASEEELSQYGMDAPELTVTAEYTYEDEDGNDVEDTFVLNVSRDPKEQKAAAAKEEDEEDDDEEEEEITAYARVGQSQIIYQISSDDYKALMSASYDSLRHLEVLSAAFEDVYQADISLDGESYSFTSKEEKGERTFYYQEEELEISAFQNALTALKADSFTDEAPAKKKELGLTVYLDNENYPQVSIDLYRYDGSSCLAVVDGESVSLVPREAVVDLMEAVYAVVLN